MLKVMNKKGLIEQFLNILDSLISEFRHNFATTCQLHITVDLIYKITYKITYAKPKNLSNTLERLKKLNKRISNQVSTV